MRRKLGIVLVMAVILSLLIVVPVSAKQPLRGWIDADFNLGFGDEATPCPEITWVGNIDIDGVLFGFAWTPTSPLREAGQTIHYTDKWMIYESPFEYTGGVFEECDVEIALWGYDAGAGSPVNAVANGTVEWVNPDGPFDEMLTGRNIHWSGSSASPIEFSGWFRIN
jgi:hypothetical protein